MGLTWEISIVRHLSPSKRLKFWTKIPWYVLNSKVLCKSTILRVVYTDFAWFLHVLVVWIPDSFPEIVLKIWWNHLKSYQIPDMLVESSFFFSSILDFLPVPWHVFSGRWHRERLRHHLHGHSALGIASEAQVDDPAMVFHGIHGYNKVIFHFMGISWNVIYHQHSPTILLPSGKRLQFAFENGYRNSWFTH